MNCQFVSKKEWDFALTASSPMGEVYIQAIYYFNGRLLNSVVSVPDGIHIKEHFSLVCLCDLFWTGTGGYLFLNETSWNSVKGNSLV